MRLLAIGTLLCALAVAPVVVAAHAFLDRAEPRVGSTVKTAPTQVRLWFTGALEPAYSRAQVLDAAGTRVDLGDSAVDPNNRSVLRVSLPALAAGKYRVLWRVLAIDGHVTAGDFRFTIAS
jgi:methionine-rich copper-binding protein CopC